MKILSINQPVYLPWLGYFNRIARADLHVVLDHVQFEKNSLMNRNRVRVKTGECLLTVPLKTKGQFGNLQMNRIEIPPEISWRKKHWETIKFNYGRAPFFKEHAPFFQSLYEKEWSRFIDFVEELNSYLLKAFSISTPTLRSSELQVDGKGSDLVLQLCLATKATAYITAPRAKEYLVENDFREAGIELLYQEYRHPAYPQAFPGFEPNMAAIDLLFNTGPKAGELLRTDLLPNLTELP